MHAGKVRHMPYAVTRDTGMRTSGQSITFYGALTDITLGCNAGR